MWFRFAKIEIPEGERGVLDSKSGGGGDEKQKLKKKKKKWVGDGGGGIAKRLGFKHFIPPYATANGSKILYGVNYASGSAGIRDESGIEQKLYKLGARKIHISGVGQIGCTPYSISYFGTNNGSLCVDKLNDAAVLFNKQLKLAVKRLNEKFKNAKFIFDDPTNAPAPTGLDFSGCCEVRKDGLCIPGKPTTCQDRNKSIFFDSIHPTEVVYKTSANRTLNSLDPSYLYPINLLQLARLQIKTKAKKNLLKSGTKILL
ncbi:hypothetical protein LWI29_017919 [Acer saccharum]|uniref:Uncharacterized protein n=1 Tax=Acer saccharum TaxID=4024 RepID=A0AA39RVV9_ACESA|nr:hypothetical protein LWI29_017919 [Acer saccharum]